MKRMLSLLLTIVLALGMLQGAACAATEPLLFDADLTNFLGFSFSDWFATSKKRAMLTYALAVDVYTAFGEPVPLDQTYVAFSEPDELSVAYVDAKNDCTYLVMYWQSQQARLFVFDAWTDSDAEALLGETHDGLLKNKKDAVERAKADINATLNSRASTTAKATAKPTAKPTARPTATPRAELWGLTVKGLATRSGPSTSYKDTGSYHDLNGKWVRVRSRAWDSVNEIWWVEVLIGDRWLWTGYWRFDSSTLPLESIPIYKK